MLEFNIANLLFTIYKWTFSVINNFTTCIYPFIQCSRLLVVALAQWSTCQIYDMHRQTHFHVFSCAFNTSFLIQLSSICCLQWVLLERNRKQMARGEAGIAFGMSREYPQDQVLIFTFSGRWLKRSLMCSIVRSKNTLQMCSLWVYHCLRKCFSVDFDGVKLQCPRTEIGFIACVTSLEVHQTEFYLFYSEIYSWLYSTKLNLFTWLYFFYIKGEN